MTLESAIREELVRELGVEIGGVASVGGGCISPAYRISCADGTRLFLKTAPAGAPAGMMAQEAVSLAGMAETNTVRVPHVLALGESWLALEWLEPARHTDGMWAALGASVAHLHRSSRPEYGWPSANFIGSLPQPNDPTAEWPTFWRERRLAPQLRLARSQLGEPAVLRFERLLDELDERLAAAATDGPSLLHGDLWSGNVHFTSDGGALIDPSCYYGHREVDLAMAALFGGFPAAFFDAYSAEWPLAAEAEARRPIYQLYYLLVHVNLFGGGYVAQTRRVLDSVLGPAAR